MKINDIHQALPNPMSKPFHAAFTLIELLIVVAIIAILAAIAVPNFLEAQIRSKVAGALQDQRAMMLALETYRIDNTKYPPALNAFLQPAAQTQSWRLTTPVAYLSAVPRDIFYKPQSFGLPGGPFGPGGPAMHYIADIMVTELWLIWSYGPDGAMAFAHLEYDPTNGANSQGDIYRAGVRP